MGKKDAERKAELEAIEKIVEEHLKSAQSRSTPPDRTEGTLAESQNFEYTDDLIQAHNFSAGWKLLIAIAVAALLSVGWLLSFAQRYADKSLKCNSESDCTHYFFVHLTWIVALTIALPLIIWLWRSVITKRESGSRIDLGKRQFVWWDGPPPRIEHSVELDRIVRVTLVETLELPPLDLGVLFQFQFFGDGYSIELSDVAGNKTMVRGVCVKRTKDWARALKSEFPHIHIERRDRSLFKTPSIRRDH